MAMQWLNDVDEAFSRARENNRPILLDFSAAPG